MRKRDIIYVALLDEGLDVWRPVEAERLSSDSYRIVDQDYDPTIERWNSNPGGVVRCRTENRDGRRILVATEATRRSATG